VNYSTKPAINLISFGKEKCHHLQENPTPKKAINEPAEAFEFFAS
jgi:hypothetical protein